MLFRSTFAPRTPLLALMHSAGRLFPRSDRSPSLSPVAHADLLQRMQGHSDLNSWQGARMQRVDSKVLRGQTKALRGKVTD